MSTRPTNPLPAVLSALACAALLALGACDPVERAPAPAGSAAGVQIEVPRDGQASFGALRIGLGYVSEADYADAAGAQRRGLTAGLWFFLPQDTAKNQTSVAHVGQSLQVAGYQVFVEELRGGRHASARLLVQGPPPAR